MGFVAGAAGVVCASALAVIRTIAPITRINIAFRITASLSRPWWAPAEPVAGGRSRVTTVVAQAGGVAKRYSREVEATTG
jgi:hypothetical protein